MNWNWMRKRRLLVQAITYEVWRAIYSSERRASVVIDIHCHEGESAIYVSDPNDPKEVSLALASGLRAIYFSGGVATGTLYESCKRRVSPHDRRVASSAGVLPAVIVKACN